MNKLLLDKLKDTSILLAWIAGLIIISCLCWVLSRSLRADFLQRSINRALTYTDDSRQLGAALAPGTLKPKLERLGFWYDLGDDSRVIVFTIIADGLFLPCAAVVDSGGKVEEIIPLSGSGNKLLNRISPGILQLYIRRIEHGL